MDLERHVREFRSIIDCYALMQQAGAKPYDILVAFKNTLAPGSTRLKVYETEITKAVQAARRPFQAKEVFAESVDKLKGTIRESKLQRQTWIENKFNHLEVGRSPIPLSSMMRASRSPT